LNIWLPTLRSGSGAEVFTTRLAKCLEKFGHRPVLQWFDRRFELCPWLLKKIPPPPAIDLVHANTWQGFVFKRAGIPLIVTEHHIALHPLLKTCHSKAQQLYHHFFVQRCTRLSYAAADAVIAVSQFGAESMRGEVRGSLHVIHNGVDTEHFTPEENWPTEESHKPFRILFIGNPSKRKGFDTLAPLAEILGADYEIQCLGGLRHPHARNHGEGIRYLPPISHEQMPDLYRSADILIAPTRFENFGYFILEAMACGLPVAGFARGGTVEQCVHNETALLCDVDDLETLAANIRRLSEDNKLRTRLARNARQRAIDFFPEEKFVRSYITAYQSILARQSDSPVSTNKLADALLDEGVSDLGVISVNNRITAQN
jgi:glycosyltransferase involved in cell wall biosynthesis